MTDEENECACCGEKTETELCSSCEEGEGSGCDCDNEIEEDESNG